jgi:hypothetical protein
MTNRINFLRISRIVSAVIAACIFSSAFTFPAQARNSAAYTDLNSFIESVTDGNSDVLRGVYVRDLLAFQIVQQPAGSPGYVSQNDDQFTHFSMASEAGNIGLLAHNYLTAGRSLPELKQDDIVVLVYGDGRTESFVVTDILRYQALDPNSPYSDFTNLDTQATLSAQGVFEQAYRGERHVTFQTCIEANGNLSWGRLFVVARPVSEVVLSAPQTYSGTIYEDPRRYE